VPLYLADTSAWNRSTTVFDRWEEMVQAGALAVCPPVVLELLWSARTRSEYRDLAFELDRLPSLPLDPRVSRAATTAQAALAERSQHRGPPAIDLLIAATAEVYGATVLHYDRHFDAIARATGQPAEWLAPPGSIP
jgi:predicted nucleic acid-binding protein